MKKLVTFLVLAFTVVIGNAQIVNIPDAAFKAKLLYPNPSGIAYSGGSQVVIDTNNNGEIELAEAQVIDSLNVTIITSAGIGNITSLVGIEKFINLKSLDCSGNYGLTNLDLSQNTSLINLNCNSDYLTTLDVSQNSNLKKLSCSNNGYLTNLNVSGCSNLTDLLCSQTAISQLDLSICTNLKKLICDRGGYGVSQNSLSTLTLPNSATLRYLDCSSNQITVLNLTPFSNLTFLNCSDNHITALDVSHNLSLSNLNCGYNQITALDVSHNLSLSNLDCRNNQITALDVSHNLSITSIVCVRNQIAVLDVSHNLSLTNLDYYTNHITTIDVSHNLSLLNLSCGNNQITALDVSHNPSLSGLECSGNQIAVLDVSHNPNLSLLQCNSNQIATLDVSQQPNLYTLDCTNNQITALNVNQNPILHTLNCGNNQVTALDVSQNPNLDTLNCINNHISILDLSSNHNLSYLDIYGNTYLQQVYIKNGASNNIEMFYNLPALQYICANESQVGYIQSDLSNCFNCNQPNVVVNSYCSFSPSGNFNTIKGTVTFDGNNNGCDATDSLEPNIKVTLNDGTNTGASFTNPSGNYTFYTQAGSFDITPSIENPTWFTFSPATVTIPFADVNSNTTIQNFCLSANGVHPDVEIAIAPLSHARPGFDAIYELVYKNKGNQILSGAVNFSFNGTIMNFVLGSTAPNSQATGSLSWNYSNLQPFESRSIVLTLHVNAPTDSPPVNVGDILNFSATINPVANDETPDDNVFAINQTVIGSFDPNSKICLEGETFSPSMVGKYVHYVIHFENTGTANAQNIVVKDILDTTKFDVSSFQVMNSSHAVTTRLTNNIAEFIFQNINLPFASGSNDGYVVFKIKIKPTLVVGDTFSNTANIYFDYNAPIVTNTATTTIATLGTQDFAFSSVFSLSPVPAKDILTITTKQNVVMSSLSIYNTLGQLVQVITNPTETIDVSGLKTGSYFIKIVSDKGTASGKFVKE